MEVPFVARQATAEKRQRRERGSINPDDIIKGAFELAEGVGIDNLSMPLLGKHLGVGVTSIYWYFRKKDDLLNAMTDRALQPIRLRHALRRGQGLARDAAQSRSDDAKDVPGQPDSVRSDSYPISSEPARGQARRAEVEKAIESLAEAGLSPEDAFDTYSAVSVHVRGSVVLQRLYDKNRAADDGPGDFEETMVDRRGDRRRCLLRSTAKGHRIGAADDNNFDFGLECILDHADRLIETTKKPSPPRKPPRKAVISV